MDTSNLLNVLASPAKVTQEVEIEARLVLRAIVEPRIDASAGDRGAISDPTPSAIRGASRSQAQQRGATTRLSQKPLAGAKSKSAGGTPSSSTPQVGSRPSAGGAEGFAIRLLNQTNQMLSKDAKDLKALTNKDPRRLTGVEAGLLEGYTRCISVTAAASRDLLAVSHRLQLAPLALEMSISNFITRCVETGMVCRLKASLDIWAVVHQHIRINPSPVCYLEIGKASARDGISTQSEASGDCAGSCIADELWCRKAKVQASESADRYFFQGRGRRTSGKWACKIRGHQDKACRIN
ncbi:hypothetical protein EV182_003477 [Spiromyces aspiralis]|uniref:Uncharacterized protein n=1 Tax=Spiromyces aspiralis TaxID=68401 RepID=A0ACC1HR64_9FUNG|nr:hypothetical protein EV182_003477 [Spiromyces aspiralis]